MSAVTWNAATAARPRQRDRPPLRALAVDADGVRAVPADREVVLERRRDQRPLRRHEAEQQPGRRGAGRRGRAAPARRAARGRCAALDAAETVGRRAARRRCGDGVGRRRGRSLGARPQRRGRGVQIGRELRAGVIGRRRRGRRCSLLGRAAGEVAVAGRRDRGRGGRDLGLQRRDARAGGGERVARHGQLDLQPLRLRPGGGGLAEGGRGLAARLLGFASGRGQRGVGLVPGRVERVGERDPDEPLAIELLLQRGPGDGLGAARGLRDRERRPRGLELGRGDRVGRAFRREGQLQRREPLLELVGARGRVRPDGGELRPHPGELLADRRELRLARRELLARARMRRLLGGELRVRLRARARRRLLAGLGARLASRSPASARAVRSAASRSSRSRRAASATLRTAAASRAARCWASATCSAAWSRALRGVRQRPLELREPALIGAQGRQRHLVGRAQQLAAAHPLALLVELDAQLLDGRDRGRERGAGAAPRARSGGGGAGWARARPGGPAPAAPRAAARAPRCAAPAPRAP